MALIRVEDVIAGFLFIYNVILTNSQQHCSSLKVSISQNIENSGFRRNIHWSLKIENLDKEAWLNASCQLALAVNVSKGFYINPDEVGDLKRLGKLNVVQIYDVDIEVPAHEANENMAIIYLNNSRLENVINVTLPIHLRYHKSSMGGFETVKFRKLNLLANCLASNDLICGKDDTVYVPFSDFASKRKWKNITYNADFKDIEFLVPIGDLGHYSVVAIITYMFSCGGCMYIMSILSNIKLGI